jgi:hypothetical protein
MLIFIFEIVVGKDGHSVDDHFDFLVKEELLVLEAFLGVSLRIAQSLLFFHILLPHSLLLLKTSKKIGRGGIPWVKVRGISARISGE